MKDAIILLSLFLIYGAVGTMEYADLNPSQQEERE